MADFSITIFGEESTKRKQIAEAIKAAMKNIGFATEVRLYPHEKNSHLYIEGLNETN